MSSDSTAPTPSSERPLTCVVWFPVSCASGAAMGSMFGYGAGLLKGKGLKGSFTEAGSSAKTFAIMSGVDQLVSCLLGKLRGKNDAYNAGIAGCCSGLAVSFPGSPQSLVQTCVAYGALSFLFQRIDITSSQTRHSSHLFHLQLPLPDHLKEAVSSWKWPGGTHKGGSKFTSK